MSITTVIEEITEAINNTDIFLRVQTKNSSLYVRLDTHTDLRQASKEAQHIWDNCQYRLGHNFIHTNINYKSDLIESSLPVPVSSVARDILSYLQSEIYKEINISQPKRKLYNDQPERKLKNDMLIQSKKWLNKEIYLTSNQEELDTLYAIYKNITSLETSTLKNLTYLAYQKYGSI